MPKVSEFQAKHKKKMAKHAVGDHASETVAVSAMPIEETVNVVNEAPVGAKSQRRPGNIHHAQQMEHAAHDVGAHVTPQPEEPKDTPAADIPSDRQQTAKMDFFGSETLKEHAPALHRSIEIIVDDWKNDGRFEGLPLGHPLFQALASMSLQKAKTIEKKLDERGVFMMARMGSDIVKMKLNELRGKKDEL